MGEMAADRPRIILDTDIGTDVDDLVALAVALRSPGVDLRAVTTVYVHAALRAQLVQAVLDVAGRREVPIGRGIDAPLLQRDPLHWAGWEGEGLLPAETPAPPSLPHAVDLMVEMVLAHPGEVTILAIGPLTNIALALVRERRLATAVRRIVIMGGLVQRRFDQLHMPYSEHNVRCDPEAAQIVLTSGAPITLVPLDVTTQVRIRRDDLGRLRAGDGLARLVADQVERYMGHMQRDWTYLHDPLACAAIVRPALLRTFPMSVQVETRGEHTRGQTVALSHAAAAEGPPRVDVALEVDAGRFERWILDVLAGTAESQNRGPLG
jgi:purine nucleosidase